MKPKKPNSDPTLFDYPAKTTVPAEIAADDRWEDRSYYMDSSACCSMPAPSTMFPKGAFILWIQPDDRQEWRLPQEEKYQLDFVPDGDTGWGGEGCKVLLHTIDLKTALEMVAKRSK